MSDVFDIRGKAALITGAGGGLGAELALAFAAAGARLFLLDREETALVTTAARIRQEGGEVQAFRCDITQPETVRGVFASAATLAGELDIVVNNAGINIPKPAEELAWEEWNQIVATNLSGTFLCCQEAGRRMLAQESGCIINICSVHGHVGSYVHKAAAYNAAKAGVINLTRSLALEWGDRGVRVNGISPGPLDTALMAARLADPEYVRKTLERLAIKRVGTPADVVGAALFLASPAAAWITGQILAVDGGWLAA